MGEEPPGEVQEWELAEHFGWTLDYIAGLPEAKILEYFAIQDGRAHAKNSLFYKGT